MKNLIGAARAAAMALGKVVIMLECAALAGLMICAQPVEEVQAQWSGPNHASPIMTGAGTGFRYVGPCTADYPIVGAGSSADPVCATNIKAPGTITSDLGAAGTSTTVINGSRVTITGSNASSPYLNIVSNSLSATPLIVTAAGLVGVNNPTPTYNLDMVGRFKQTYTVAGSTTGSIQFPRSYKLTIDAATTDFVWADMVYMYNSSPSATANNVARYTQAIKYSTSETDGQVIEMRDQTHVSDPTEALQALELDLYANGTDANDTRKGLSILALRDDTGGADVEVSYGVGLWTLPVDIGHNKFKYGFLISSGVAADYGMLLNGPINTMAFQYTDGAAYLTAGGLWGLGTSSPQRAVHISSAGATDRYIRFTNSLNTTGLDVGVSSSAAGGFMWMYNNNPIGFATNNTQRMWIAADGKVGIGANPTYLLDVSPTTSTVRLGNALTGAWPNTTTSAFLGHNSLSQSAAGNYAIVQDASGATAINSATSQNLSMRINNTTYLLMDSTGKVGIGTGSTPSYALDVYPTTTTVRFGNALTGAWPNTTTSMFIGHNSLDQSQSGNYALTQDASGATVINGASGQYVGVRINNSTMVRVNSTAVGIGGVTSPASLLDVNKNVSTALGPTITLSNNTNPSTGNAANIDFALSTTTTFVGARIQSYRTNAVASGDNDLIFSAATSTTLTERMRIVGATGLTSLNGAFARGAPVTKTADFTLAATENWIIANKAGTLTVTLPAASSWTGRELTISTITANTVVSASSNVVPVGGGAAGTAILAATAGKWATLVSDGASWVIMKANWLLERDLDPAANDNSPVGLAKVG